MVGKVSANRERLEAREAALFARLDNVHAQLQRLNDAHNRTGYGCDGEGNCCRIGLELPMMEIENIARHLRERFAQDPGERARVVRNLKRVLHDPAWKRPDAIGDLMCAFYDKGCTIYPFRPAVCRMYGVILEINDDCPRRRLASGKEFLFASKEVDQLMADYYRTLDAWGRLHPRKNFNIHIAAGLLRCLLPRKDWEAVRATTAPKFWKTDPGYRTMFKPSYKRAPAQLTRKVAGHPKLRLIERPPSEGSKTPARV